jgi:pimeloyl-ACP methyl ester carboxylesterase
MTAKEIRDLPYLQWQNKWAWMETMRGKQWEQLLQQERQHYRTLITQPRVKTLAGQMKQELTHTQQYLYVSGFQAGSGQIDIVLTPESQFYWKHSWHKRYQKAYDLDVVQGHVWYVTETDKPYVNQLRCEDQKGQTKWSKRDVSAEVAIQGPLCYFIRTSESKSKGEKKKTGLYCCDAATGRNEHLLYEEKNEERYIGLVKGSYRTLYLLSEDPSESQTYRIEGQRVVPLFPSSVFQLPLGRPPSASTDCALLRRIPTGPWEAHGVPLSDWKLPPAPLDIGWANLSTGHLITIHEGSETLWYCAPHRAPQSLLHLKAGSFFFNAWEAWEQSPQQRFMVQTPSTPPFLIHVYQQRLLRHTSAWPIPHPVSFKPLEVHKWHATSADGTSVPYAVVYEKDTKPKAQLVYVYGAYGSTTPVQWPHAYWWPLLKRGWAVVYAYVRGGGDNDEAWVDQARREYRHRSVDDVEAVIRAAQRRLRLHPSKTVLYGRSAGGVPVGAMVARWPKGEVIGAAFTEVPYVDVLRTSTNPELPLTVGEYKEFGNPAERLTHFHELLHVSPIDSLPAEGAPGVFVLTRVGLEDEQVYAYESFKWIQRLRGHVSPPSKAAATDSEPKQKYITYERHEEHVYRAKVFPHFRGLDLAVLEAWVEGDIRA